MAKRGINNSNLKQENRGIILKYIATGEGNTRIELAKKTGLSKMSVTNVIAEFLENGIVEEQSVASSAGQGRNPICLSISPAAPKLIGLFIHRDNCTAVLCDMRLQILKKAVSEFQILEKESLLQKMFEVIDAVLPVDERVMGIGVGAVGPVDIRKGMILNPPNFYGIKDFEVTTPLKERYHLPVYLDSQYNCAALAEKFFGVGRQYRDFVFVGITNGIGSGIISDDRIFRNSNGLTSELGHVSIDWQGRPCNCGNKGCMETYAGIKVIETELQRRTQTGQSFREFCADVQGNAMPYVQEIFTDMMNSIACGLVSLINLVNPQAIVVGHEGYYIPGVYLAYLEEQVNAHKLSGNYRYIEVRKSGFGEEAHLRGCACTVLNQIFEGKRPIMQETGEA